MGLGLGVDGFRVSIQGLGFIVALSKSRDDEQRLAMAQASSYSAMNLEPDPDLRGFETEAWG